MSICGWICREHFISGRKSNYPASPDYIPPVFNHVKSPQKRRLLSNMDRYERITGSKRKRFANNDRVCAAQSLLDISDSGNGSQFCEPHSGIASSTIMSMHDIELIEVGLHTMQSMNSQLHMECEQLKEENQRLIYENTYQKEENHNLMERCKKLEDSKIVTKNKLKTLYF